MNTNSLFSHKTQEPESGYLYIVGTPIGNLDDLSYRAINILKHASLIACEDTRQTKKIMSKFEFTNNLTSFNKYNSFNKIPRIINDLKKGKSVALVSDAGMPSICDPGEDLIKEVISNGLNLICISLFTSPAIIFLSKSKKKYCSLYYFCNYFHIFLRLRLFSKR